MPSTRTPRLRIVGAVVVGNGTWPTRWVRSVAKAKRVVANIVQRSTLLGSPFTPTISAVLGDGTCQGASAAAAKTFLQARSIKQLKGPHSDSLTAKYLRT